MLWVLSATAQIFLGLILISLGFLYYLGTRPYGYWKKKGIAYMKPKYPFVGTLFDQAFSIKSTADKQQEIYKFFKGKKYGGIYNFMKPALFINDPLLIDTMLKKDFQSFFNRTNGVDTTTDPLSAHLLNLKDEQWKSLRQKLTPTFTSGKLKGMHQELVQCSHSLINYIDSLIKNSKSIEVKQIMTKLAIEVIASCVFGINTNTISDENSKFFEIGLNVFRPNLLRKLRRIIRTHYPGVTKIFKWLGWKGWDSSLQNFFLNLVKSAIRQRETNNITRNDFIQLLMDLKHQEAINQLGQDDDKQQVVVDDVTIAANTFMFFLAGFETTASTLGYCLYELSKNPQVQEEAYQQIVLVLNKYQDEITFESIQEITIINQIFEETLRMHPVVCQIRRICTQDYLIPGTNLVIEAGTHITIPSYSLHHDPQYFPEPEKFDITRFEKDSSCIKKGTYLPFGDGPRMCIGKRFATMEMQVVLVKLILNYKFTFNSRTPLKLKYNPLTVVLASLGGIWINIQKRKP